MRKRVIVAEWLIVMSSPAPGTSGPVSVEVENADGQDRPLALALAHVLRVWFAARRPS